ncbi:GNAT family N-acetyltransferase [Psychrobacter okhotskensis]|uniref:GNAT family N-acetyltransferase n=1 Tax=Psychrobacter okhotskensis TaxID=212403 RepID=UPI00191814D3|nr:GNAT family protein [Psychrobacter okhotskensis]
MKELTINIRALEVNDIDDEYCNWFENIDGHLNYYTGSGRKFDKNVLIEDYQRGIDERKYYYYLIFDISNKNKIGNVKIGPIDWKNKTSDLVVFIGNREYLGKGLASKAIGLANEVAFDELDIRRLQGGMIDKNIPSIKAYTRAGWYIEATMKGFYLIDGENVDRVCVCCLNPKYFEVGE